MTAALMRITEAEFAEIEKLRRTYCLNSRSAFSTNAAGEIWAFKTHGLTPDESRTYLQSKSKILDLIAAIYVELPGDIKEISGGRFFVDRVGVSWKDRTGSKHMIRIWNFEDRAEPIKQKEVTFSELRSQTARRRAESRRR